MVFDSDRHDSASDEFESMIHEGDAGRHGEVSESLKFQLEQAEYDIAEKVATEGTGAIAIQDVVDLLQIRIRWEINTWGDDGELTTMLENLQKGEVTAEAMHQLKFMIGNAKASVLNGRKYAKSNELKRAQAQWFGVRVDQESAGEIAAENVMADSANKSVWQPFLVLGLENGYKLLLHRFPEMRLNQEKIAIYKSEIEKFVESEDRSILGLEADFLDIDEILAQYLGDLQDVRDLDQLEKLSIAISDNTGSQIKDQIFQALRAWSGKGKASQAGQFVVEGRFVENNANQLAASEFITFLIRVENTN